MHVERTNGQLWIVDDEGERHNLCDLIRPLLPEKTKAKTKSEKPDVSADLQSQRPAGDQTSADGAGADDREEADPQGSASGGQSDGRPSETKGAGRKDKTPAKASQGKSPKG